MRYIKQYDKFKNVHKLKNIVDDFDQNFKVGDIIICIDNNSIDKDNNAIKLLVIGEKYIVVEISSEKLIRIRLLTQKNMNWKKTWKKTRFIHEEDFNDWQLYNDVKNFNL